MQAEVYDIVIECGSTFGFSITFQTDDVPPVPVDLTGYLGRGQIREKATDTAALADFVVDITDPSAGLILVSMDAETTAAIPTPNKNSYDKYRTCYYDIEVYYESKDTSPDIVIRLLNGKCLISPEITKEVI